MIPSTTGNHHQQEKHAKIQTKNKKNTEDTLCSNRPLGTFFFLEADLKGLRQESEHRRASVAAASFDNSFGNLKAEDCL